MVWDQLSINKPHLVYIILGGFTSMFMLVSLFIKEKMYIGEATVATLCGLIFGPHAANLINPLTWGNTDQITLEFSRIVLVVQCFAVGVELPKAYMERHWLSVVLLLVPVMTFGWLITSLFVWWMIIPLTWLESLAVAACVTATDPVLASSVVGKGKFAKRVPKHIRDLLSAESGCNDGMAFPFIYLALNLIHYHLDAKHVIQHWFCNTILYECIWGAVYGVLVGYIARQAIKLADRKGIIDRESFLVFYFVLALFCAGSGSLLGMDDLLVGFAAGVGFSNDGWFLEKTEESHVSNVIDLLLNLTYFVYLGTIIPWDQFNSGLHGLEAWRLVVIAIMVIFFRRIPIMLMLKPIIPDIKTWREALFCGHFGPIGVGAIFVAILARAELETGGTTPLAVLPDPSDVEYVLIYTIWPIVTFMVISSILVHGSSIAVFTLGKRINTLTMTLSYTTGNDQSSSWMTRLPRVSSTSKLSQTKSFTSDMSDDEKADYPPGQLPPIGIPQLHLRRQKEDEYPDKAPQRASIRSRAKKRSKKKSSLGAGGPISESAITPQRTASNSEPNLVQQESGSDTLIEKSERPSPERVLSDQTNDSRRTDGDSSSDEGAVIRKSRPRRSIAPDEQKAEIEAYEEKNHLVIEDEEGNVVRTVDTHGKTEEEKLAIVEEAREEVRRDKTGKYAKHKHQPHARNEEQEIKQEAAQAVEHPEKHLKDHFRSWAGFGFGGGDTAQQAPKKPERKRGPAHAYQYGNTIIVEDEDGEVIHKYEIPGTEGENKYGDYMKRMSTWVGLGRRPSQAGPSTAATKKPGAEDTSSASPEKTKTDKTAGAGDKTKKPPSNPLNDDGLRMVISNAEQYGLTGLKKNRPNERRPSMQQMNTGRRMSTQDFIRQMQQMDRESRQNAMDEQGVDEEAQRQIHHAAEKRTATTPLHKYVSPVEEEPEGYFDLRASGQKRTTAEDALRRPEAARMQSGKSSRSRVDEEGDEEEVPEHDVRSTISRHGKGNMTSAESRRQYHKNAAQSNPAIEEDAEEDDPNEETAAERRRRLAALGLGGDSDSSEDEEEPRQHRAVQEPGMDVERTSPTSARQPLETRPPPREREVMQEPPRMRVQWGSDTIGAVRGKGGDDVEAQQGASGQREGGGLGKRFKGFLNK